MKKSFSLLFVFCSLFAFSSHNRAGEITYQRVAPFTAVVAGSTVATFNYLITITLYTDDNTSSQPNVTVADRCVLDSVFFGDGQWTPVPRMNGGDPLCSGCISCGCDHCGEMLLTLPGFRVKKNIYQVQHTFPGPGEFHIRVRDPNRNADVANIPHSDLVPFYIESVLFILNNEEPNNSPVLLNPPIDRACLGKCFTHNPAAFDPDHDSLSYAITKCMEGVGDTIPGYTFPNANTNDEFDINPTTGYLKWCSPRQRGQYNIAFIITEWRKSSSGYYVQIGRVLRDMQVNVEVCPNNDPPIVLTPPDTCVEAGTLVKKKIKVSDPNVGNTVTLNGTDGGFSTTPPQALLTGTSGVMSTANNNSYLASFSWQTTCDHISQQPYECVFKAVDNGTPVVLAGFGSFNIRVVPPVVKNVTAVPMGSSIKISWQLSACNPTTNPLVAYKVYRKNDCSSFSSAPCQTGIPPASGFVYIGQANSSTGFFIDTNNGNGLTVGQSYSYLVVAVYSDGLQTFASAQVCTKLKRDVPLLLNVDVRATSSQNGSVYIRWDNPLPSADNFDTIAFPGPYTVALKYRDAGTANYTTVFTSASPQFLKLATDYLHTGINTTDNAKEYMLDFTAGTTFAGSSQRASSVFLSAAPDDRKVHLQWTSQTPWQNAQYVIWRKNPTAQNFVRLDSVSGTGYTDSTTLANPIVNHYTYCYKIESKGAYSDISIEHPLLNFSQEACGTPKDLTPPCTPTLNVQADCALGTATVTWNDVRTLPCGDDAVNYILYYKPTLNDAYAQVASGLLTIYLYDGSTNDSLISGCYAIQAVDSSGNASAMGPDFCLDNCPIFELPNIFTPNKDGVNEFFQAIRVRQIKQIDMNVYDRWGNLVYKTSDPYFHWNGVSILSGQTVSDGTLFYICDVFESRLKGLTKRNLKGFVQIMR